MIDKDFWQEVLQTIRQQKWRSLMTAFGVFWGLFMLMILIGAGMGFKGGLVGQLNRMPSNSIALISDMTSLPYMGFERDRQWTMNSGDVAAIKGKIAGSVKQEIFLKYAPEIGVTQSVTSPEGSDQVFVAGVSPDYCAISPQRIIEGRYINDFDIIERRKVCVIGEEVAKSLFPSATSPLGKQLKVGETSYAIVGVTRKTNALVNLGPNESKSLFLPITTQQYVYNQIDKIDRLFLVLNDEFPSGEYVNRIDRLIRQRHNIHLEDDVALISVDLKRQLGQFDIMLGGINSLVWLVGLGTLLAGIIGISNIMLVTVKERTQEIGVRRALGAEPLMIIKQIICESLILTLAAGIVGIVAGCWVLYLINKASATAFSGSSYFANPYVPFTAAIAALLILVVGGMFAGWLPAKRAMAIKAIDALREE